MNSKTYSFLLLGALCAASATTIPLKREAVATSTPYSLDQFNNRLNEIRGLQSVASAAILNRLYGMDNVTRDAPCSKDDEGQRACASDRSAVVICQLSKWWISEGCLPKDKCYAMPPDNNTTHIPTPQCLSESLAAVRFEHVYNFTMMANETDMLMPSMRAAVSPYEVFRKTAFNATITNLERSVYASGSPCGSDAQLGTSVCSQNDIMTCSTGSVWQTSGSCPDNTGCYMMPDVEVTSSSFTVVMQPRCMQTNGTGAAFGALLTLPQDPHLPTIIINRTVNVTESKSENMPVITVG